MTTSLQNLSHLPNILAIDSGLDLRTRGMCGPTPPFSGGFIPAFARCCFCIAISLLVFTSPSVFPLLPRIIPKPPRTKLPRNLPRGKFQTLENRSDLNSTVWK